MTTISTKDPVAVAVVRALDFSRVYSCGPRILSLRWVWITAHPPHVQQIPRMQTPGQGGAT